MPELAVIGVVALLVLGPERLPGAARTVGALVRRAQRSWTGLRADIERELAADELKRQLRQVQDDIGLDVVKRDLDEARSAIARDLDPRAGSPASTGVPTAHADVAGTPPRTGLPTPAGNDEKVPENDRRATDAQTPPSDERA